MRDSVAVLLMVLTFIMLAFVVVVAHAWSCTSRWADSGIESKYALGAGCRIKIKGVWIPDKNYREVD